MFCSVCLDSVEDTELEKCPYCGQDPLMFDYCEREKKAAGLENFDYGLFRLLLSSLRAYQRSIKNGSDPKRLVHPFLEKQSIQHGTIRIVDEKRPQAADNTGQEAAGSMNNYPQEPIKCDACQQETMFFAKNDGGQKAACYQLLADVPGMLDGGRLPVYAALCKNCNQIKLFMPKMVKRHA